jgi:hypothetical protein
MAVQNNVEAPINTARMEFRAERSDVDKREPAVQLFEPRTSLIIDRNQIRRLRVDLQCLVKA